MAIQHGEDKTNRYKDQLQRLFSLRLFLVFSLSLSFSFSASHEEGPGSERLVIKIYIIAYHAERDATPLRGTPMGAYHGRQGELARSLLSCALFSSFAFVVVVVVFFFFASSRDPRITPPSSTRPRYSYRDSALICFSFRLGSLSRRDAGHDRMTLLLEVMVFTTVTISS